MHAPERPSCGDGSERACARGRVIVSGNALTVTGSGIGTNLARLRLRSAAAAKGGEEQAVLRHARRILEPFAQIFIQVFAATTACRTTNSYERDVQAFRKADLTKERCVSLKEPLEFTGPNRPATVRCLQATELSASRRSVQRMWRRRKPHGISECASCAEAQSRWLL